MAKFCKNCGNELNDNETFCGNCGTPIEEPIQQPSNVNYTQNSNKSKMAAGLLGIFLGSIGVHNFYLGYTGKAIAQLLITVLSCGLLSVVSGIWGLIEGILILTGSIDTDAQGNKLVD